jgi:uncharacterized protein involved in exopolysaccharide biosynthesis
MDTFGLYKDERKTLVQEEVIELMRKDISIKLEKGWTANRPGAFRVGYEGKSPETITQVANQLANLFIEENLKTREQQAEGTAEFIDSQLQDAKKSLDTLETQVSRYKLAHNGELPEQESSLNGTLSRLQLELQGNQDAVNRAQQSKVLLQSAIDMAETSLTTQSRILEQRPQASAAAPNSPEAPKKKSETLQAQYDALRLRYQPNYPDMVAMQREIELEKKKEAQEADALTKSAPAAGTASAEAELAVRNPAAAQQLVKERERIEGMRIQLKLVDRELAQRTSERDRILKVSAQYQGKVERLPVREQEMAAVTRDYEMAKTNYKSLLDKKLAAGLATDMEHRQQAERFTLLDPARIPEKPVRPNRLLLQMLGAAISLAEVKGNAILGEWELPTDVVVLGRVPQIKISAPDAPRRRRWRLALLSSAALVAIAACAAGIYLRWRGV